jgi:hypothetical protein
MAVSFTGGRVTGPSFNFRSESDSTAAGVGAAEVCDAVTGGNCAFSGPCTTSGDVVLDGRSWIFEGVSLAATARSVRFTSSFGA